MNCSNVYSWLKCLDALHEVELLEITFFETVRHVRFRIFDFGSSRIPGPVWSVGRTADVTKKPSKINK